MPVEAYVEATGKRAFAGAIDWPGWCRAGRDEDAALEALFDYGARYARCPEGVRRPFHGAGARVDPRGRRADEGRRDHRLRGPVDRPRGGRRPDRPALVDEERSDPRGVLDRVRPCGRGSGRSSEEGAARRRPGGGCDRRARRGQRRRLPADDRRETAGISGRRGVPPRGKRNGPRCSRDWSERSSTASRRRVRGVARGGRPGTSCAVPPGTSSITPGRSKTARGPDRPRRWGKRAACRYPDGYRSARGSSALRPTARPAPGSARTSLRARRGQPAGWPQARDRGDGPCRRRSGNDSART